MIAPVSPDHAGRLGLGTAQFGLPYGITNTRGQVPPAEARRILEEAAIAGLRVLDTASTYGDSERLLGRLGDIIRPFRIVTKTVPTRAVRIGIDEVSAVRDAIVRSRRTLRRERLDAVLVHHARDLFVPGAERLMGMLRESQARGEIAQVGVSVYEPDELAALLEGFAPDIVQIPLNLFNQRFQNGGLLAAAKRAGVEIHARSLFLQGTLLARPDALPAGLKHALPAFDAYGRFLEAHGLTRLQACLGYGLSVREVDCLVLGVAGYDEFAAILGAIRSLPAALPDFSHLAVADDRVVNPSQWQLATR